MKRSVAFSLISAVLATTASSAEQNFAGEYADKKFLNGQAVFSMSIEQSGNVIQVSFDAGYSDGHGAAPEGTGSAKIAGKGLLQFTWTDSFKNSGTGTISRVDNDIVVSMKPTRVADSRCLAFYGQKIRLKQAGTKL